MWSEAIDGFVPSLRKNAIVKGYASSSRDGIHFLDVGMATIRYRVGGQGAHTLVFVTDPPIVIEHYDEVFALLGKDFRVVVFEPPGFGFSLPSMRLDYRFNSLVEMIVTLLDRLALGPYTFIAPCVLGYAAIGVAQSRPELIQRLVLPQVPSWKEMLDWKATRDPKGILSTPVVGQLMLKLLKKKRTPDWYRKALGQPDLLEHFNQLSQDAYRHGAVFNLASGFQRFLSGPAPFATGIRQSSLVIWGQKDKSHCHTCQNSSMEMLPGAKIVAFQNAGHFPELETTDRFAETIVEFILSDNGRGDPCPNV